MIDRIQKHITAAQAAQGQGRAKPASRTHTAAANGAQMNARGGGVYTTRQRRRRRRAAGTGAAPPAESSGERRPRGMEGRRSLPAAEGLLQSQSAGGACFSSLLPSRKTESAQAFARLAAAPGAHPARCGRRAHARRSARNEGRDGGPGVSAEVWRPEQTERPRRRKKAAPPRGRLPWARQPRRRQGGGGASAWPAPAAEGRGQGGGTQRWRFSVRPSDECPARTKRAKHPARRCRLPPAPQPQAQAQAATARPPCRPPLCRRRPGARNL